MDSDSDEESAEMEDMEEGEIRQNVDSSDGRHDEASKFGRSENTLVDNVQSLDNQKPVEVHGFSSIGVDQNSKSLHGNGSKAAHVDGVNVVVIDHVENPNNNFNEGPNKTNSVDINVGPNNSLNGDGPVMGPNRGEKE
ncbi:hypothetical protein Hanom_Chr03g00214191 [Helianthus anomalus]